MTNSIQIYQKYYIDREYEQIDLFRLLNQEYGILRTIYPGCYVHISPSFIFQDVVYIDSDKTAKKFFSSNDIISYIEKRKEYSGKTNISFYGIDYKKPIEKYLGSFDLLISQYAGFISEYCKDYLKVGGLLLVNNSHADAGLASLDNDYKLIATIHKVKGKYRINYNSLGDYFSPKKDIELTKEYLHNIGKGVGYTKTAPLYLFSKVQ
ncbi:hypothetical protein HQ585_12530 [candidate division KSB1 bacterium]|nr:hypothetical protein [candidate division KSB1 bacterium]